MKKIISDIMENWRLRISASISLGIHLLLIFTATFLFSGTEVRQTPIRNVKVILYPLEEEKKSIPKFVLPLSVKNQMQRSEKGEPLHEEKQREPLIIKEYEPSIPLPSEVTVRDITFFENPELVFSPREEEKKAKEPVNGAMDIMDIALDKAFDLKKKENISVSSLPGPLKGNNLSDAASGEGVQIGKGGSRGGGSGNGLESETGSGEKDSPSGGSRKGAGILGELFSSSGGGGGYARYAQNPKPPYPKEAREQGIEGEVLLRVEVLVDGRVGLIEVKRSSGHEILDQTALSTVKQWKFIPAKRGNGSMIPSWVNIPIKFQLQ